MLDAKHTLYIWLYLCIWFNCIYGCMFCMILFNFVNYVLFIVMFMYPYCYVCSVLYILFHCVVL
jgi:hypothetical protein